MNAVQADKERIAIFSRLFLVAVLLLILSFLCLRTAISIKQFQNVERIGDKIFLVENDKSQEIIELARGGNSKSIVPIHLIAEPDTLNSWAEFDFFISEQNKIAQDFVRDGTLLKTPDGKSINAKIAPHSIFELPLGFWVSFLTGALSFLIGGTIWSLRANDKASMILALNGLGLFIAFCGSGIYASRQLAISGDLFVNLTKINHLGGDLMGLSLLLLAFNFPRKILYPYGDIFAYLVFLFMLGGEHLRFFPSPSSMYYPLLLLLCTTIVFFIYQAWRARKNPADFSAIAWISFSIVAGFSVWAVLTIYSLSIGKLHEMPEAFVNGTFILIYLGIAIGVARFRLFDFRDFAFRFFFYLFGVLVFGFVDAGLLFALRINETTATPFAIAITAFAYLPFRDVLWRKFFNKQNIDENFLIEKINSLVFENNLLQKNQKWRDLLQLIFRPQEIIAQENSIDNRIIENGNAIETKAIIGLDGLKIIGRNKGLGTFNNSNLKTLEKISNLLIRANESKNAFEQGIKNERKRVARDLHDDVGSKLLSSMLLSDGEAREQIRSALKEVRAIAHGLNDETENFEDFLSELRLESAKAAHAANIEFIWSSHDLGEILPNAQIRKAVKSIVRECITNAAKHANCSAISVTFQAKNNVLSLEIKDNGIGLRYENGGIGLKNMQTRAQEIGATLSVEDIGGTSIKMAVEL